MTQENWVTVAAFILGTAGLGGWIGQLFINNYLIKRLRRLETINFLQGRYGQSGESPQQPKAAYTAVPPGGHILIRKHNVP